MNKTEIISRIVDVLKRHPEVVRAELYGSVARSEHGPHSDVDLILEIDEALQPSGFKAFSLYNELDEAVGRKTSVLDSEVVDHPRVRSHMLLGQRIQKDRQVIYDRTRADNP